MLHMAKLTLTRYTYVYRKLILLLKIIDLLYKKISKLCFCLLVKCKQKKKNCYSFSGEKKVVFLKWGARCTYIVQINSREFSVSYTYMLFRSDHINTVFLYNIICIVF